MSDGNRLPPSCPSCGASMQVRRLSCSVCDTGVDGRFSLGVFGSLTREQLAFAEAFVMCRGKIKDVEQRLGISYPTVVARLDEVVARMAGSVARPEPAAAPAGGPVAPSPTVMSAQARAQLATATGLHARERDRVLVDVAAGRLDAREAAERLRRLAEKASAAKAAADALAEAEAQAAKDENLDPAAFMHGHEESGNGGDA